MECLHMMPFCACCLGNMVINFMPIIRMGSFRRSKSIIIIIVTSTFLQEV